MGIKIHPDWEHEGLATIQDIYPGAVLWHVYGLKSSMPVQRLEVLNGPITYRKCDELQGITSPEACYEDDDEPRWLMARYTNYVCHKSLNDCGIGANYNLNRLCLTEQSAREYHRKVMIYLGHSPEIEPENPQKENKTMDIMDFSYSAVNPRIVICDEHGVYINLGVDNMKHLLSVLPEFIKTAEKTQKRNEHFSQISEAVKNGLKFNAIKLVCMVPTLSDPNAQTIAPEDAKEIVEAIMAGFLSPEVPAPTLGEFLADTHKNRPNRY